ncbi:MAG TPA: bifunctional [glutamine synthetase] adenylyltransferase/[glutamine synthetase]-adenylyl-L-tyrosine phosphorylase [Candidatus Stackebrandtia faecavium]|nr:bifunctional [glutamine synthetase] adenylyltransferase/[glutamine synthetase]-adenylyl-L-tyrosine phosphorylase [Candidatus Stackebrandtia faecavium]
MSELTARQFARLSEADPSIDGALETEVGLHRRVRAVLAASEALGDYLVANPRLWHSLRVSASRGLQGVQEATDVASLRYAYRERLLQISADDLTGDGDIVQVSAELSRLADATMHTALSIARSEIGDDEATRLCVVAMGKCGANELNYLSDVDVVLVAEGDLGVASRYSARMMNICNQTAWQVDAGLRPEGRNGALVRTVDSYLAYYQRWAHTWEFQALMKARPAAGDLELGQRWAQVVTPLIWDTVDDSSTVDGIRAMRRKVLASLSREDLEYEIKLGRGGLRDIEFAVQLMQLVHGRSDERLRVKSTLGALEALTSGGYLGRGDGESLSQTYRFLRTLEHRLQLQKLRRTHTLPADDPQAMHWLARVMGFRDVDDFRATWRQHAVTARRLHEKLFYRPLLEAVAEVPTSGLRLTPEAATARLEVLGFADAAGALRHLSFLTSGISRTAAIQRTLLPVLLGEFADAPEPDRGLLAYRKVSERLGRTPWYLRLLRDGGPIALRLARLLATSRYFTDLLLRDPDALRLLARDAELAPREPALLRDGMRAAAARHVDSAHAIAAVRAIRRRELLRIACADLLGLCDVEQVGQALSDLNDAVLDTALGVALRHVDAAPPMAIVAMGRYGGGENSYASDADVLFVCDGDSDAVSAAASVVSKLRSLLSSPAHEPPMRLDMDLRPEGRQGPLVRSLAAYQRYYSSWAKTWELQALLRARFVAGDASLGDRFFALVDPLRYPVDGMSADQLIAIRRMKARIDTERLPRGADRATHVKLGPGGLTDVEWSAQLIQLRHAGTHPSLQTTSTLTTLMAAAQLGLLDAEDTESLRHGWLAASRVRNALTLSRGNPSDQLPRHGPELAGVLAALGEYDDDDPGRHVDEYLRVTRHAAAAAERVFYED